VSGLDPASDGYSFQRMEVAETLVDADAEGRLQPGLATDWEVSGDGLTWRFRLREGVRFHDGTPLDAPAAVASLRRAADRPGILQTVPLAGIGVPPLKWSPHWDRIIPFEEDRRWLGSETSRKRSS
jgi:peptide/nickel transport system substrate-binding protein